MKHITLRRLRALSLSLGLVLCFGLFAGCSSQDSSTSQDPSSEVTESTDPSEDPSEAVSDTTDTADDGTGEDTTSGTSGDTSGVTDVVGQVTAVDGSTVSIQVYSAPEGTDIESYASVDMSQYSATEETDEVDLTDATIGLAQDGALDSADASQIAVGDMLLLSYDVDTGELLQAVIYPQDSGETYAAA